MTALSATARRRLVRAAAHLRVAVWQTIETDDEIIAGHVRDALALLDELIDDSDHAGEEVRS